MVYVIVPIFGYFNTAGAECVKVESKKQAIRWM